jgi:hypothetical protein
MSMDDKKGKCGNGRQGNRPQSHYGFTERPEYEFYQQGITEPHRGWYEIIRNARGRCLVAVVVVLALCKVACEFLEKGSDNLSYKSIIGTLFVAGMVLLIGLVSLRRIEDTDVEQKENRKKDKIESAEPGAGGNSPGQNRRITTRNRSSNPDRGGE